MATTRGVLVPGEGLPEFPLTLEKNDSIFAGGRMAGGRGLASASNQSPSGLLT